MRYRITSDFIDVFAHLLCERGFVKDVSQLRTWFVTDTIAVMNIPNNTALDTFFQQCIDIRLVNDISDVEEQAY